MKEQSAKSNETIKTQEELVTKIGKTTEMDGTVNEETIRENAVKKLHQELTDTRRMEDGSTERATIQSAMAIASKEIVDTKRTCDNLEENMVKKAEWKEFAVNQVQLLADLQAQVLQLREADNKKTITIATTNAMVTKAESNIVRIDREIVGVW